MQEDKTATKRTLRSEVIAENTLKPNEPRFKSQKICGSVPFHHQGPLHQDQIVIFNVYSDLKIGLHDLPLPSISLLVDEDCQTTSSVRQHGAQLCVKDLQESLGVRREHSESESSYASYEDC